MKDFGLLEISYRELFAMMEALPYGKKLTLITLYSIGYKSKNSERPTLREAYDNMLILSLGEDLYNKKVYCNFLFSYGVVIFLLGNAQRDEGFHFS
jgi:hypothetical protein